MMKLKKYGMKIIIYEPELKEDTFYNLEVVKDINEFKQRSELIITNRMHEELKDVKNKVYTRDLYERDWKIKGIYVCEIIVKIFIAIKTNITNGIIKAINPN